MLVLSRLVGERIRLLCGGMEIWIMPVAFDRGRFRIGIQAPQEVKIDREERLTAAPDKESAPA
jgi:carbon storage regulator CsrA